MIKKSDKMIKKTGTALNQGSAYCVVIVPV